MSPFNTVTLSSTGTTLLAQAGQNAGPEGWLVAIRSTSWTGSLVFASNQAPPGAARNLVNVAYQTGGTWVAVAAGTAITANGSIVVSQTGYDLYVTETHTAGSVSLDVYPVSIGTAVGGVGTIGALDVTAGTFGAATGETGAYTFPGALSITGNLTLATGKALFGTAPGSAAAVNVDEASYTTLFSAKTASIFNVTAAGNGTFGGTLAVTGAVTLASTLTTTVGGQGITQSATADVTTFMKITANNGLQAGVFGVYASGAVNGSVFVGTGLAENLVLITSDTARLTITGAGNSTFAGTLGITSTLAVTGVTTTGADPGGTAQLRVGGRIKTNSSIGLGNFTVATLPTGVDAYSHAFVTDATLTAITGLGLAPTGGGTNKVPVYTVDGTAWLML